MLARRFHASCSQINKLLNDSDGHTRAFRHSAEHKLGKEFKRYLWKNVSSAFDYGLQRVLASQGIFIEHCLRLMLFLRNISDEFLTMALDPLFSDKGPPIDNVCPSTDVLFLSWKDSAPAGDESGTTEKAFGNEWDLARSTVVSLQNHKASYLVSVRSNVAGRLVPIRGLGLKYLSHSQTIRQIDLSEHDI